MSQFIGRETSYSSLNIFQNFQEIYAREGLGGFFVYVTFVHYSLSISIFSSPLQWIDSSLAVGNSDDRHFQCLDPSAEEPITFAE